MLKFQMHSCKTPVLSSTKQEIQQGRGKNYIARQTKKNIFETKHEIECKKRKNGHSNFKLRDLPFFTDQYETTM